MGNIKEVLKNYKILFKEAFTDLKTKGRRHRQIPNILTATRLVAAPLFIIPAAILGNVPLIVIFTILFSLTDAVDGFIARKWNLVSELGKDLDAICDKIFAGTLLIATSIFNPVLLCNLFFEVIIAIVNAKEKIEGTKTHSLYIGKIKTCFLYPLLGVGLINKFINIKEIFYVLLLATSTMQLATVVSYAVAYDTKTGNTIKEVENKLSEPLDKEDSESDSLSKEKVIDNSKKKELKEMRDIITHEIEIHKEDKPGNEHINEYDEKVLKK